MSGAVKISFMLSKPQGLPMASRIKSIFLDNGAALLPPLPRPSSFSITLAHRAPLRLALGAQLESICPSLIAGATAVKEAERGRLPGAPSARIKKASFLPLLGLHLCCFLYSENPLSVFECLLLSLKTQIWCLLLWRSF